MALNVVSFGIMHVFMKEERYITCKSPIVGIINYVWLILINVNSVENLVLLFYILF